MCVRAGLVKRKGAVRARLAPPPVYDTEVGEYVDVGGTELGDAGYLDVFGTLEEVENTITEGEEYHGIGGPEYHGIGEVGEYWDVRDFDGGEYQDIDGSKVGVYRDVVWPDDIDDGEYRDVGYTDGGESQGDAGGADDGDGEYMEVFGRLEEGEPVDDCDGEEYSDVGECVDDGTSVGEYLDVDGYTKVGVYQGVVWPDDDDEIETQRDATVKCGRASAFVVNAFFISRPDELQDTFAQGHATTKGESTLALDRLLRIEI